jgi:hypothetical protein
VTHFVPVFKQQILDTLLFIILIIFWPITLFLFFNTQTIHIKPIKHNSTAMFSLKTLYPGGIRTLVFSVLEADAMSTVPDTI